MKTSITIDYETLKLFNRVKSLMEYKKFKKLNNDKALLVMCTITEGVLLSKEN